MIRVTVNNRGVQAIPLSPVTVGAEGIVAAFLFSDDWAGLAKTAIFKGSGEEVEKIVLNNQCTVPPEVLTEAGGMLQVGVYGNDGLGTLIRPTIWGVVGRIEDSAISEDAGQTGTTPSWAAQVQNAVQEALIVAQGVRTDADAGEFDGATFTPSVAADGTLSWTNDKEKENPQPVNIKGPQGPQGNPGTSGQDGVTPDFQIGSVETLNPGQSATATITGTPAQPVLNLGIPQGEKGEPGGGSGTSDYTQLSNKPQINGHTLSGNQSASDLGLGTYSKPASGIPKTDLASDVQASLGKADTALQTAPVQSVNGKTGAVNLTSGDIAYDETETYQAGTVGAELSNQSRHLNDKQDAPSTAGTPGQVLGLDSNLNPAWIDQAGLNVTQKLAFLNCFEHVAWTDASGATYYDELYSVLINPEMIASISASYENEDAVYLSTPLDDLRQYITVTATYSDSSTKTVSAYTISGTLTVGSSVLTIGYLGKTATITVTVTEERKSDMNEWSDGITYTDLEVIQNSYYNSNGNPVSYNNWDRTGKVYCHGAAKLVFRSTTNSGNSDRFNFFFDDNGAKIGNAFSFKVNGVYEIEVAVPSGAYYFGISADRIAVESVVDSITPYA